MYPVNQRGNMPDGIPWCPTNKHQLKDFHIRQCAGLQIAKYFPPEPLYLLEQLCRTDIRKRHPEQ